jgi:predicted esterase
MTQSLPFRRSPRLHSLLLPLVLSTLYAGCGGPEATPLFATDEAASEHAAVPSELMTNVESAMTVTRLCDATPPPGSTLAPPPPKYAGTCPKLVAGKNTIRSGLFNRTFLLALPAGLDPSEKLPVVFLWHWLGGSADSFYNKGEVQAAVDGQRFIAVIPEAKADMLFKWPFDIAVAAARQEEEYRFFDNMLACVAEQFNINNNCVASAGVSAGALFTDQLVGGRGQYLSSALSLSGGVGAPGGLIKPFTPPEHRVPMMVLWGGPRDICIVINFNTATRTLEDQLVSRGHFFLECQHNCGHGEPPMTAPSGLSKYAALWQFVFDHPYWLPAGDSPYKTSGVPSAFPSWCAIGKGSATPRTGMCPAPGC